MGPSPLERTALGNRNDHASIDQIRFMNAFILFVPLLLAGDVPADHPTLIVVVGAPGSEEYQTQFSKWAENWESAAKSAQTRFVRIEHSSDEADSKVPDDGELLKQTLAGLEGSPTEAVWLVLIGHGTFDGKKAKFNFRGPDATAEELAEWLRPLSMPVAVINCASASGPFINALSGPNRVVVTSTKSGAEHNYARFGAHISTAISDTNADLDKDGQTSLLEAFLSASASVQDFYKTESRLATEHALIDDNGDGLGTPADWFQGFRAVRSAKEGTLPDGNRANQFVLIPNADDQELPAEIKKKRDELELEIAELRTRKAKLSEDEYYGRLEPLLIELARLYQKSESTKDKDD